MTRKKRNQQKPPINDSDMRQTKKNVSGVYHGAARFIEVAPPGIQYRGMINVDHITNLTFAPASKDFDTGERDENDEPIMEKRMVGYMASIGVAGQNLEFTFARPDVGAAFWNQLLDDLATVGAPVVMQPRLDIRPMPPPEAEVTPDAANELVGPDGQPIERGEEGEDLEDPVIDELEDLADEIEEDRIEEEDTPNIH